MNIVCLRQADSANRLYAKEFTFDKSSSITIYQKLHNSNGNNYSSCMLFFLSPQHCCFSSEFNNTLLYQNEGAVNTVARTSSSLSFKFVVEIIIHHYYCMLEKSFIWLTRAWFHHMFRSKQGKMLLKFNILHLHYVTHYWARIEYQPF